MAWPGIFRRGRNGYDRLHTKQQRRKRQFRTYRAAKKKGGIGHWWRDNDTPPYQWHGPSIFADGQVNAVSLIKSNLKPLGNLEAVADVDGHLMHFWRDDGFTWEWSKGTPLPELPVYKAQIYGAHQILPVSPGAVAWHTAVLKTGKTISLSSADHDMNDPKSFVLDVVKGTVETPPVSHHLVCSGHSFLSDGRLFIASGLHPDLNACHIFDPDTQTFEQIESMEHGRWYPTCATMPDGRIFIISGTKGYGFDISIIAPVNNTFQMYDPLAGMGKEQPVPKPFSVHFPPGFDTIDLYPFVFVLPSGKIFIHSRNTTRFYNPNTAEWEEDQLRTQYPFSRTYKTMGTAVLLPLGPPDYRAKVMLIGGGGADPEQVTQDTPSTDTCEILDADEFTPVWRYTAPMRHARVMPQSVLLPDGKVLVTGGSAKGSKDGIDPVLAVEAYDPATGAWSELCPASVPRLYHTSAVLLPDARVMIAGKDAINNSPAV